MVSELVKLKSGQRIYSGRPPGTVRLHSGRGSRPWKLWQRGVRRLADDTLAVVIESVDIIGSDGDPNTKSTMLVLLIDDNIMTAYQSQCKLLK